MCSRVETRFFQAVGHNWIQRVQPHLCLRLPHAVSGGRARGGGGGVVRGRRLIMREKERAPARGVGDGGGVDGDAAAGGVLEGAVAGFAGGVECAGAVGGVDGGVGGVAAVGVSGVGAVVLGGVGGGVVGVVVAVEANPPLHYARVRRLAHLLEGANQ
jgi:hypothetical protein